MVSIRKEFLALRLQAQGLKGVILKSAPETVRVPCYNELNAKEYNYASTVRSSGCSYQSVPLNVEFLTAP